LSLDIFDLFLWVYSRSSLSAPIWSALFLFQDNILSENVYEFWIHFLLTEFRHACKKSKTTTDAQAQKARKFLTTKSSKLQFICDCGNIEMGYVIRLAKQLRDNGWKETGTLKITNG
tara:strand:- start:262 stop:612 length:351 start_codon:yes stop_codon:yes gene_type:complete